jgi:hypothetical protein
VAVPVTRLYFGFDRNCTWPAQPANLRRADQEQPTNQPRSQLAAHTLDYLLTCCSHTHTQTTHKVNQLGLDVAHRLLPACLPPCSVAFQQRRLPIAAAATAIRHPRTHRTHACLAVLCASSFRRLLSSLSTRPVRCSRDSRRLAGVAWLSHSLTISGNRRITD